MAVFSFEVSNCCILGIKRLHTDHISCQFYKVTPINRTVLIYVRSFRDFRLQTDKITSEINNVSSINRQVIVTRLFQHPLPTKYSLSSEIHIQH